LGQPATGEIFIESDVLRQTAEEEVLIYYFYEQARRLARWDITVAAMFTKVERRQKKSKTTRDPLFKLKRTPPQPSRE
jgi:hypothetical protein